jgi:hypothetical protein
MYMLWDVRSLTPENNKKEGRLLLLINKRED